MAGSPKTMPSEMSSGKPAIRIAVIIVNFNGGDTLRACLEALNLQTRPPNRCLIIDNHSTVKPLRGLEPWLKGCELIHSQKNLGFAAANNLAVRQCPEADWIAFLNPDAFPEPDWLERLEKATKDHPKNAFFACKQLNAALPDLLDGAGDSLTRGGRPFRRGQHQSAAKSFVTSDKVFSSCGASTFINRSIYEASGGFDEDFFCYLEDLDLGFRLNLQGHSCRYLPDARVHHLGSAITGNQSDFSTYHGHRNLFWLYLKNMPAPIFWLYLPQHIGLTFIAFFLCLRRGQGCIFIRAKWDAIKDLKKFLGKRSKIQRSRTASILAIWKALSPEHSFLLKKN